MSFSAEIERWRALSPTWTASERRMRELTVEVTRALVDALDPRPGERVLDLACGAGDPSAAIAERGAQVVSCDGSPQMLAAAREATGHLAQPLHLVVGALERPPFRDASFDALCSRFGVMFAADDGAWAARWTRLLKPGGRVALAVWGALAENPYFTMAAEALEAAGAEPPEPEPGCRSPFECAESGALVALLEHGGFVRVTETRVDAHLLLPDVSAAGLLDLQLELSLTVRERCAALDPARLQAVRAGVTERAAAFEGDGGLAIPARVLLVRAERAPEPT